MDRKTILVVDDEPYVLYMLKMKLAAAGFAVLTAADGEEAFELARRHHPDLIITDHQMPATTGLELCQRLLRHAETADIPAMMLTARGHKVALGDLRETNVRELLPKPFSIRQVLTKIGELIGAPSVAA